MNSTTMKNKETVKLQDKRLVITC